MFPDLSAIEDLAARARLDRYLHCLVHWSPRINLTGAQTLATAFEMLVLPILGAETLVAGHVIDVGSGNGSPGLILAAFRPDLTFVLLEPRAKRWAFLREATREMGLLNVSVRRERSEAYRGDRGATVTMRAVGLSPESVRSLVLPGGCVLIFGGPLLLGCEEVGIKAEARIQRRCFT